VTLPIPVSESRRTEEDKMVQKEKYVLIELEGT
jgi:hypothetical protein